MCLSIEINHPENVLEKNKYKGVEYIIVHNGKGYRCGYVHVPKENKLWGKSYDDIDLEVHGGLNFSQADTECGNKEDNGWWIGFYCGHYTDKPDNTLPNGDWFPSFLGGVIRNQEYVREECKKLINQVLEQIG